MLRVTLEFIPDEHRDRPEVVGVLDIWNLADLAPVSDYGYHLEGGGSSPVDGQVLHYERKRGPWELIRRVVMAANFAPHSHEGWTPPKK